MIIINILISLILFNNVESNFKDEFYKVLSSDSELETDKLLNKIESLEDNVLNQAYIATLKMKKSGFEKILKNKISIFKEGAESLDSLISKNPNNLEFQFLRIIIQEKAPKILKYYSNIQNDKDSIIKRYKTQNNILKKHIIQYAKISLIINVSDLN